MSRTNIVLTAMRVGQRYRAIDLAAVTNIPASDVRTILAMLERNGLIDVVGSAFEKPGKRRKVYGTKQNELFA